MGIMDIMAKDTSANNGNVALNAAKGIDTDIDAITSIGMKLDVYLQRKEQAKEQSAINLSQMFANEQLQQFKMQQDVAQTKAHYGLADAQLNSLNDYRNKQVNLQNRRADLSEKEFNEKVREFDAQRQDAKDRLANLDKYKTQKQTNADNYRKAFVAYNNLLNEDAQDYAKAKTPEEKQKILNDFNAKKIEMQSWGIKQVKTLSMSALAGKGKKTNNRTLDAQAKRQAYIAYNKLLQDDKNTYLNAKTQEERDKALKDYNLKKAEMQSWGIKIFDGNKLSSTAGNNNVYKASTPAEFIKLVNQGISPLKITASDTIRTTAVNMLKANTTPIGSALARKVINTMQMSKPDAVDATTAVNPSTTLGAENYSTWNWAMSKVPFMDALPTNQEVNQEIINQTQTLPTPQQPTAILVANLMGKNGYFQNGLVGDEVHAQKLVDPFNDLIEFVKANGVKSVKQIYTPVTESFTERHTPDWMIKWNYNNAKSRHSKEGDKEAKHLKRIMLGRENKIGSAKPIDIMKYVKNINETLTKNKPSEGKAVLLQSQLAFENLSQGKDIYSFHLPIIYYDKKAHKIKYLKDKYGNSIKKPVDRNELIKLAMPYVLGKVIYPVKKIYGK